MSSFWTDFALVLTGWASWSLLCVYNHHIVCNHLFWTSFCLCDLYDHFHHYHSIVNDFLLGCGDCCCWLNCEHLLLLGFQYFFSLILVQWCLNKLIEAFSPVFALVDKYCPFALFCSIVFAKFLIMLGAEVWGIGVFFWLLFNHLLCESILCIVVNAHIMLLS